MRSRAKNIRAAAQGISPPMLKAVKVLLAAVALVAGPSMAEEAPTESTGASLQEVIVTARKVQESAQNVPVTVASLTGVELERSNVFDLSDLQEHITGIAIQPSAQGGSPQLSIRSSSTNGVATYLNEVPMTNTTAITNAMYDIGSVEVLRGPQGTLFGVNTTGGAVVFQPNKPTDRTEGLVDFNYGNFNRREATAVLNVPITDILAVRIAGNIVRRDGTITNLTPAPGIPGHLNDDNHNSGRFSARLKVANITNDFLADIYEENDAGNQAVPVALNVINVLQMPLLTNADVLGNRTVSLGGNATGINLPIFNQAHMWGLADTFVWDINDRIFAKNVLGYRSDLTNTFQNNGGEVIYLVDGHTQNKNRQWTEEPTLHIKSADGSVRAVAGLFYLHADLGQGTAYNLAQNVFYGVPAAAAGFLPPGSLNTVAELSTAYYQRTQKSKAIFTQVEYDFAQQFTFTLGARYNWDTLSLVNSQHGYSAGFGQFAPPDPSGNFYSGPCIAAILSAYQNFNPTACTADAHTSSKAPSFNAVIQDKFADKSMAYLRVAGGYIAGGLNNQIRESQYQSFAPEKVTEVELGVKSDWKLAGRPIRTNFDVFYGKYRNKQETENGAYSDNIQWVASFNAGRTKYFGADLDATYIATDQLSLAVNWTYVDSKFDSFDFPAVGIVPAQSFGGTTPALTPRNTISVSATEYWPVPSSLGELSTTVSGYYRSKQTFTDVQNIGAFPESVSVGDPVKTVNFTTDWSNVAGSKFSAGIWIRNAFNSTYVLETQPQAALGYASKYFGDPRTFGGHVRYSF